MVEIEKLLKNTVKKGKVIFGFKKTKKAINNKSAKLIVIANNCPFEDEIVKISEKNKTPIFKSKSDSIDLGYTCGKTFAVSTFAILDDGGTNILDLTKGK
jgi:large subunit ribosomal protein L30e